MPNSNFDHFLTGEQFALMLANGARTAEGIEIDYRPVVKLFTPDASCTWLLTELDPQDPDIAFGLCDLGMGFPELGSVRLSELNSLRGKRGLGVERDAHFIADKTLSEYAHAARMVGKVEV